MTTCTFLAHVISHCNAHVLQYRSLHIITDLCNPELRLSEKEYFAGSAEAEIRDASRNDKLTNENTSGCPDIDAITAATVYVTSCIAFDAIGNDCGPLLAP
jgi:hypothetical protein